MISSKSGLPLLRRPCRAVVATCLTAAAALTQAAPLNVMILGSGSPVPSRVRFSQSILIEAGKQKLLLDAGRGATIRLTQAGVPLRDVDAIFATHLHTDYIDGLQDLWSTGWLPTPWGSRVKPLTIYGRQGTVALTQGLTAAFAWDIKTRVTDEKLPPDGIAWDAHDIAPGLVYENEGVKVTAFLTHHGDLISRLRHRIRRQEGRDLRRHHLRRARREGGQGCRSDVARSGRHRP